MMKLSLFLALFFSFLAFARAEDDVTKLSFATSLCRHGQPDNQINCLSRLQQLNLADMSYLRVAADVCPEVSRRGRYVLRCLNKANERFGLSIRLCNEQQTYVKRIDCVRAIFTQADNQNALGQRQLEGRALIPSGVPARDNSSRGQVDKGSQDTAPIPAGAVEQ